MSAGVRSFLAYWLGGASSPPFSTTPTITGAMLIPAEKRTFKLAVEQRSFVIPVERRTFKVPK